MRVSIDTGVVGIRAIRHLQREQTPDGDARSRSDSSDLEIALG